MSNLAWLLFIFLLTDSIHLRCSLKGTAAFITYWLRKFEGVLSLSLPIHPLWLICHKSTIPFLNAPYTCLSLLLSVPIHEPSPSLNHLRPSFPSLRGLQAPWFPFLCLFQFILPGLTPRTIIVFCSLSLTQEFFTSSQKHQAHIPHFWPCVTKSN